MNEQQTDAKNLKAAGESSQSSDPAPQAQKAPAPIQTNDTPSRQQSASEAEARKTARETPTQVTDVEDRSAASLAMPSAAPLPGNMESVQAQHEEVDRKREALNEHNRPGHEKNMEEIERTSAEAQGKSEHPGYHVPTGKQENRNTPIVNADGSKTWL